MTINDLLFMWLQHSIGVTGGEREEAGLRTNSNLTIHQFVVSTESDPDLTRESLMLAASHQRIDLSLATHGKGFPLIDVLLFVDLCSGMSNLHVYV
jgi:hypothetical protein